MYQKNSLFPIRILLGIQILITIILLGMFFFIIQPLCMSILIAFQGAHEAGGTWTGSVVTIHTTLAHIVNLFIPLMIVVLMVYWIVRSQHKEWRGEYEGYR